MKSLDPLFLPIVTSKEMARLEVKSIADGASDQSYMDEAGQGVARYIIQELHKASFPIHRVIFLIGKGNNGGDALCAGGYLLNYQKEGISFKSCKGGVPSLDPRDGVKNNLPLEKTNRGLRGRESPCETALSSSELARKLAGSSLPTGGMCPNNQFSIKAFCLFNALESSKLNNHYRQLFESLGGDLQQIQTFEEIKLQEGDLIIDGLLGTGFHGETEGLLKDVIVYVNQHRAKVLSMDIPSGLDGSTGDSGTCIKASRTFFLELPKQGFFLKDAFEYVGRLERVPFGLDARHIQEANYTSLYLTDHVKTLLPPIKRTRHKYQTGYVIALAGSTGMSGAALLSTFACMRSGAGIVRLFHAPKMNEELASSFKELIKTPLTSGDEVLLKELNRAKALLLGPGVGQDPIMHEAIVKVLREDKVPAVIDADALLIFSEEMVKHRQPIVLTPHKMEMMRCLKLETIESEESFWGLCQRFANERDVVIVLKGAPTRIFSPHHLPVIMARGDPGLAKAGSGDVLTGIIAAYLAMGLTAFHSALLGSYIHGVAGEMVSDEKSAYSVIASDLIEKIPLIYKGWMDPLSS